MLKSRILHPEEERSRMKIEIFKSGTHTDSAGNQKTWTDQDLDAIVAKYNPAEHEAPAAIGHPEHNAPAFGWVESLERKGHTLYATFKDLIPEFVDMLKKGLFKKRSISIYPDLTLRHVGFLGAMPPAIKGLADIQFNEAEATTIEFSDVRMSTVGRVLHRMREFIIEKFGIDVADTVVNEWEIDELKREETTSEEVSPAFSETSKGGEGMPTVEELQRQLDAEKAKTASFSESDKAKDAETARLKKDLANEKAKNQRAECAAFCDSDELKERITPAMKPAVLDFMEILSGVESYEFAEGDGKVKKSPAEAFKGFLKALPKQVEFSEVATKKKATDKGAASAEMQLDTKAREKMAANKELSYSAAFAKTQKENPELAQEYSVELKGGK
jgi:hypothetical protein